MGIPTACLVLRKGSIDAFYKQLSATVVFSGIRTNGFTGDIHATIIPSRRTTFKVSGGNAATAYKYVS